MSQAKPSLALFLGSGFSAELGLPTTALLQDKLLDVAAETQPGKDREEFISKTLREFWEKVFGWQSGDRPPSVEDHFTQIDLAANSGHYLGHGYNPKRLRALRRFTIHRMFKLLDVQPTITPPINSFFARLHESFGLSVVTTNWDIAFERCLQKEKGKFNYGIETFNAHGAVLQKGTLILKLHGSTNWSYCDCCRNLSFEMNTGKPAFLDPDDFCLFPGGGDIARALQESDLRVCEQCDGRKGARVGTFSYRKDLSLPFFQSIRDSAQFTLQRAEKWLVIGYSMPEADIEIRHLLKSAQLARAGPRQHLSINVVLKGDCAASERYQRFFGLRNATLFNSGLGDWIKTKLDEYCSDPLAKRGTFNEGKEERTGARLARGGRENIRGHRAR